MNAFKTTCFLDDPYRKEGDSNTFSSYFVLYFYFKESLGKAFCFYRAKKFVDVSSKPKSLFNSYCASIFPITKKMEDLVTVRNKLSIFIHGFLTHTHSIGSIDPIFKNYVS